MTTYSIRYRAIFDNGEIIIQGKKSEFVGPSPSDLGATIEESGYLPVPFISDRVLK